MFPYAHIISIYVGFLFQRKYALFVKKSLLRARSSPANRKKVFIWLEPFLA